MKQPDLRPRAAREGHARLHDRLQADPALEQVVPGARQAQRRAGHRRRRARSRANSVVTGDGEEREVDAIIFGTGFQVTDMPVGRHGARPRRQDARRGLAAAARGRTSARRSPASRTCSCCSAPTPGLGHSSMVYMIESQIALRDGRAARHGRRTGADTVRGARRTRPSASTPTSTSACEGTVWNTGCASWYLDETGRNATLWPDWTLRFRQRHRAASTPRTSS